MVENSKRYETETQNTLVVREMSKRDQATRVCLLNGLDAELRTPPHVSRVPAVAIGWHM